MDMGALEAAIALARSLHIPEALIQAAETKLNQVMHASPTDGSFYEGLHS